MRWREPPADQKVVSSSCSSSAVRRLQGLTLCLRRVLVRPGRDAIQSEGEYYERRFSRTRLNFSQIELEEGPCRPPERKKPPKGGFSIQKHRGTGLAGPLVLAPVGGGRLHEVSQPGGELLLLAVLPQSGKLRGHHREFGLRHGDVDVALGILQRFFGGGLGRIRPLV